MPSILLSALHALPIILPTTLQGRILYHPHCVDEETEAWRG